jgi:DNA-binding MarR family transcriptional regulator
MSPVESKLPPPHFPVANALLHQSLFAVVPPGPVMRESVALAANLIRGADCLVAALQEPTAEAGLNEARYRVLAGLGGQAAGECSQAELAAALLQSESNLSTLLERMSADGLISRRRSDADRRRSLIRLTADGQRALQRADRVRAAVVERLLRLLAHDEISQLCKSLAGVVESLEASLSADSRCGMNHRAQSDHRALIKQRAAPGVPLAESNSP